MLFNPTRLSIARKRRLLNKKALADLVKVTPHTISRCELGATAPNEETVATLARVLEFPVEFFYGADLLTPEPELVSFRSQKAMTAAVRDAALAAGAIGFLVSDWVEARFDLPSVGVPELGGLEPDVAAISLRQIWGLGNEPVTNTVHLLESRGVRVMALAENSKHVNAFSLWRDYKPFVFLNTMKTAENSRFDAMHELGHLVMHQDGKTTGRAAEEQANAFASEFLMPRSDVLAQRRNIYSLDQLRDMKSRWRVSLMALTYRVHKLGLISDWKYRDFCIQIASRYGHSEPDGLPREKSVVWQKVMKSLWTDGITPTQIANDLRVPVSEVSTLLFGVLYDQVRPVRGAPLSVV